MPNAVHNGAKKRVIVEFSSPNLGKEFNGAHLRSTVIGSSIASLYEGMGWDVCRLNFLGDWGKHIGLLTAGWSRFGSDELFQAEPLRHLLDIYTKIETLCKSERLAATENLETNDRNEDEHQPNEHVPISAQQDHYFKKMEDGDSDTIALWEKFREACVKRYGHLYSQLGINFDEYSGESEVSRSTINEVETILTEKGIYENINGAWVIDFKKHGPKGLGTVTARHPNGTTSYLLRDVGAVLERRRKYNFEKMIYVVASKQDTHFQQLFRTLELMGEEYHLLAQSLEHVNFGKDQGLTPDADSSGLLLGDILERSHRAVQESLESHEDSSFQGHHFDDKGAAGLALTGQELSIKRSGTLKFTLGTDEGIVAPTDSYPGLQLQRWLDEIRSRIQKAEGRPDLEREELEYTLFEQEEAYADTLRLTVHFPNVVKHAFEKLEPSIILSYLLQVVDMLSSIFDESEDDTISTEAVEEAETAEEGPASSVAVSQSYDATRAAFYECISTVLGNGMNLIGLMPVERIRREAKERADTKPAVTALPTERHQETNAAAIVQEAKDETATPAVPQGYSDETAVAAERQEVVNEARPTTTSIEEQPPHANLQEDNVTESVATARNVNEDAVLPASLEEPSNAPITTEIAQEVNEDTVLSTGPLEVREEQPGDPPLTTEHSAIDNVAQLNDKLLTEDHRHAGLV